MVEIKAFKTTDGEMFENKNDAEKYQAGLDFMCKYEGIQLFGKYAGGKIDAHEMLEWLNENQTVVRDYLSIIKE